MPNYTLSIDQLQRAEALVTPALTFLSTQDYPLGEALIRYCWTNGPARDVTDALAAYQNDDGGFGRGLEVDIKSPASNPFAARIAMHTLLVVPNDTAPDLRDRLRIWLDRNQHKDGDWHFSPEIFKADLAPWFTAWEFPSLNPACCVAGLAKALGLATPRMLDRVESLFADKASPQEATSGNFYRMLPYVEYATSRDVQDHEVYVEAVAQGIIIGNEKDAYDDAKHFFDHALNAGEDVMALLPNDLLASWTNRLLQEPAMDGGWPTQYDPAWASWTTASALVTLARLRRG